MCEWSLEQSAASTVRCALVIVYHSYHKKAQMKLPSSLSSMDVEALDRPRAHQFRN